jgi:hypothetical protein
MSGAVVPAPGGTPVYVLGIFSGCLGFGRDLPQTLTFSMDVNRSDRESLKVFAGGPFLGRDTRRETRGGPRR